MGAVGGRDAGGDAFAGLDGLGECGAEAGGVLLRHGEEAQIVGALLGEGEADEAAAVAGHEIDGFGSDMLGGQGQIALVLTILVVDHNDHAAGANFGEGAGDVGEGRVEGAGGLGMVQIYFRLWRAETAKMPREGTEIIHPPCYRNNPLMIQDIGRTGWSWYIPP